MKRLLSGLLLAFTLTACGSMGGKLNKGDNSPSPSADQKSEAKTADKKPTETKDPLNYYKGLDKELQKTRDQYNKATGKSGGQKDTQETGGDDQRSDKKKGQTASPSPSAGSGGR